MANAPHGNVALFVAGALEPSEDAAFAEHLTTCPACRAEIAWMSELSTAVGQLDPPALADPPDPTADLFTAPPPVTPIRRRRGWLIAAAAALLVIGGTAGFLAGRLGSAPAPDPAQAVFNAGTVHHATDTATQVSADVAVRPGNAGIEVAMRLVDPTGPKTCELIVITRDGTERPAMSWLVPDRGFTPGTPLLARGEAGVRPDQITRFEIRSNNHLVLAIPA